MSRPAHGAMVNSAHFRIFNGAVAPLKSGADGRAGLAKPAAHGAVVRGANRQGRRARTRRTQAHTKMEFRRQTTTRCSRTGTLAVCSAGPLASAEQAV